MRKLLIALTVGLGLWFLYRLFFSASSSDTSTGVQVPSFFTAIKNALNPTSPVASSADGPFQNLYTKFQSYLAYPAQATYSLLRPVNQNDVNLRGDGFYDGSQDTIYDTPDMGTSPSTPYNFSARLPVPTDGYVDDGNYSN